MKDINISDRITEGYYNKLGDALGQKTRERVHWICNQVYGDHVLDVGCSQGIISILLGREGFKVTGVDTNPEAIDFATHKLELEREATKKNISFSCDEFIGKDFGDIKYDTIIATEILEHLISPKRFIAKFADLLKSDGKLIITVPFGINNYFDHKKTYFLTNLIEEVYPLFRVTYYNFLGKWLGIVCEPNTEGETFEYTIPLLKAKEDCFYSIEDSYLKNISNLKGKLGRIETELKDKTDDVNRFMLDQKENQIIKIRLEQAEKRTSELEGRLDQEKKRASELEGCLDQEKKRTSELEGCLDQEKKRASELEGCLDQEKKRTSELESCLDQEKKRTSELESQLVLERKGKKNIVSKSNLEKKEKNELKKELLKSLDYEKSIIIEQKRLKSEIEKLKIRNSNLDREYKNLRSSKLGRVQVMFWRRRK